MKITSLLFTVLMTVSLNNIYSQCRVSLGEDFYLCPQGHPHMRIPNITLGVPPYTFSWRTVQLDSNNLDIHASFFLGDTSASFFNLSNYPSPSTDLVTFVLTMTDSIGSVCYDTLNVTFSSPGGDTLNTNYYISSGDSILLSSPTLYPGAIAYSWTPNYNISSTLDSQVTIKPNISTKYILTIDDWDRCQVTTSYTIIVDSIPLSFGNQSHLNKIIPLVFPNPVKTQSYILVPSNCQIKCLKIFDTEGREVYKTIQNSPPIIDSKNFSNGLYFYSIVTQLDETFSGKFVVEK